MSASAVWREAREVARKLRVSLFGEAKADREIPADQLIDAALKAAGLRCQPRKPTDPLLSGAHAVLDTEVQAVWVRADAALPDRFVYVAHEIAHLHLHHLHAGDEQCHCQAADFTETDMFLPAGYGPRQRRETEANIFAREFLLPVSVAKNLFEGGSDARAIATRLKLPLSLVFNQLEAATAAETAGQKPSGEPTTPAESSFPAAARPPVTQLDPSQQAAATVGKGPLLVVAGPGTGKTRTLVARVLYLVQQQGVSPDHLLLITFTRKAVEEMRERLAAIEPEIARRAAIHTYHSYGLDLLRRHGKAAQLPPAPVLLEKADVVSLLERHAASLGLTALRYLHDLAFPLPDVYESISRAKDEMLTPQDYAEKAVETGDARLEDAARVFAAYEHLLEKYGALDYSDLVNRSVRLLEENEAIREAERGQWQHILVDEYQDINRSGARLIKALAGDGAGLWVVGDVRQAIYAFRGASPENVTLFERDYPDGQRMDLAVNYRSRPELVGLFGIASQEGIYKWVPARKGPEEPPATITYAVAPSEREQTKGMATRIREFREGGYSYGSVAVLCRTRRQAKNLRAGLAAEGIPVAAPPAENGLLSSRDARALVTMLARAVEPTGPAARVYPELPAGLPFRGDTVDFWCELLWGQPGWARKVQDTEIVSRLLALARAFRERASVLLTARDDPRREFLRHLRRIARYGGDLSDPEEANAPDAVRVVTIHSAKGLEYPIVFIPNLSRDYFPTRPGVALLPPLLGLEGEAVRDEEARLFFVALTRARDHLVLSRAERYGERRQTKEQSHLLLALQGVPGLQKEFWRFPETSLNPGNPGNAAGAERRWQPEPSRAEPTGEKPTVTFAEADLYARCPRRYFYEKVQGLKGGERSPYSSFIRVIRDSLTADDPVAELEYAMERHGLEDNHPHTPVYRQAAEEILSREAGKSKTLHQSLAPVPRRASRERNPEIPALPLELEHGTLTLQPDKLSPVARTVEWQTFRKAPEPESEPEPVQPDEGEPYLLAEAARRAAPTEPFTVEIRYMQTGQAYPLKESPYQRKKYLGMYNDALRGIRNESYPPAPRDPTRDCPECPFFFICPD